MPRLFDVGPLPQIKTPDILDTTPLIPLDLNLIARATSDKQQNDLQRESFALRVESEHRQQQMADANMLKAFADDTLSVLKSADGTNLNPVSPFQKQAFEGVKQKTNEAINAMSQAIDMKDYKGAYKILFNTKANIFQDANYKKSISELENLKMAYKNASDNPGKYDPAAITNLYSEMSTSTGPFDESKFIGSNLAMFDELGTSKDFFAQFKPQEVTNYQSFLPDGMANLPENYREGEVKIQTQAPPDQIRQSYRDLITNTPGFSNYLRNRGIEPGSKKYEDYINSRVNDNLLQGAGVSYQKQGDKIVGVYKTTGYSGVSEIKGDKEAKGKAGKAGPWDNLLDSADGFTQPTIMSTKDINTYDHYKTAYTNSEAAYNSTKQAFDVITQGKTINGLAGTSTDQVENLIQTINTQGLDAAKNSISVTNGNGVVDQVVEDQIFNDFLPKASMAYAQKKSLNVGVSESMANTYDEFAKELENSTGVSLDLIASQVGITKDANGAPVLPADLKAGKVYGGEGLDDNMISSIQKAYDKVLDKHLPDSYKKYIQPTGERLKYFRTQQDEGSADYAAHRAMEDAVISEVIHGNTSFYTSNDKINDGLPMDWNVFNDKKPSKSEFELMHPGTIITLGMWGDMTKKTGWNDLNIEGVYVNPAKGNFGVVAYPRLQIDAKTVASYQDIPNTRTYKKGDQWYAESTEQIVIPWDKFGDDFYKSYYSKYGTFKGIYDAHISAMQNELPEGTPIPIDIGNHQIMITPKGPVGADRTFQMNVPAAVADTIETAGLPDTISTNIKTSGSVKIPAISKAGSDEALNSLHELVTGKPYLTSVIPTAPVVKDDTSLVTPPKAGPAKARVYEGDANDVKLVLDIAANGMHVRPRALNKKLINEKSFANIEFKKGEVLNKPSYLAPSALKGLVNLDKFLARDLKELDSANLSDLKSDWKLTITETFRDKDATYGAKDSLHKEGKAFDIRLYNPETGTQNESGFDLYYKIRAARNKGIEAFNALKEEMFGTSNVTIYDPSTDKDHKDHIHAEFN